MYMCLLKERNVFYPLSERSNGHKNEKRLELFDLISGLSGHPPEKRMMNAVYEARALWTFKLI